MWPSAMDGNQILDCIGLIHQTLWYVASQNCSIKTSCTRHSSLDSQLHTRWSVHLTMPILEWCSSLLILLMHQALHCWLYFMLMHHFLDKAWPIIQHTVCYNYFNYCHYCNYCTYICYYRLFVEFAWRRASETKKLGASGMAACLGWKQGYTAGKRIWFVSS